MNDFTKEELEFIFNLMINTHQGGIMTEYNNVLIKLKSLIDNYCEHELYETSALINHCVNCEKSKVISL